MPMSVTPTSASRTTVPALASMSRSGDRIAALTCYDASFATMLDHAGIDVLLVGDSLGMVIDGHTSTLAVTVDQMTYHTRAVAAGAKRSLIVSDMPFGSYQESPRQAFANAVRLMGAGAQMVKLEGGAWLAPTVEFLVARGIPVCGHLGLQPQSVHRFGGYKAQGRSDASAREIMDDARLLVASGIGLLVLEMVPATLAASVTEGLPVPTIGIGAGPHCSGQVLVLYDMLGIYPGKPARFVRNFMTGSASIEAAIAAYVHAVKDGSFPAPEHCI